ncbi:Helix-loop-helix DNA-binding domain protein [Trichuris suis]|nr:Helix-loop-helix DNA-binding domain protein [Trichuris suis]
MASLPSLAKRRSSSEYCTRRSNAEKHRRIRLSDRIACLRKALPIGLLSAKPTKADVIDCACQFLSEVLNRLNDQSASLESTISCEEHEKEISRLQAYCKQLEKRCAHYASIVDSSETLRFLDLNLDIDPPSTNEHRTPDDSENVFLNKIYRYVKLLQGLKKSASSEKSCIVIYSPRVGGGKRKRAASPFKSALKCRQILPRPVGESCGERLVSNSHSSAQNAENGTGLMANANSNANYFTLVHINPDKQTSDSVRSVPIEAPLLSDGSQALRISSAVQTEEVLNDVLSMTNGTSICVDSATSPIVSNELNSLMETYFSNKRMEESVIVGGEPVPTPINPVEGLASTNERTPKKDRHSVASLLQLSDLIDEQMEPVEDLFFNDKSSSNTGFEESELICDTLSGPVEQPSLYPSYMITPKAVSPSGRAEIAQVNTGQCDSNVSDVGAFPVAIHAYEGQLSLNDPMHSFSSRPAAQGGSVFPSIDSLINDQPPMPANYERQNVPVYKQTVSRQPANFSVEYLQQTSASSQDGSMSYDSFFGVPTERSEFLPCSEFKAPVNNVHWPGNGSSIDFWPRLFRVEGTSGSQAYTQFSDGQTAVSADGRDVNLSKPVFEQPLDRQVYSNVEITGSTRPVGRAHQFQIESMFPEVFGNESTHQSQAVPQTNNNASGNTVSFPWLNFGPTMIPSTGVQSSFALDPSTCGLLSSQHSCSSSASLENTLHCSVPFSSESQMVSGDGLLGNCVGLDTANCFL